MRDDAKPVRFADLNIPPPAREPPTLDPPPAVEGLMAAQAVVAERADEAERRAQETTVYLHAWLDLQQDPAVLKGFSIHGEQHPEQYDNGVWALVLEATGPNYQEAKKRLRKAAIAMSPHLAKLRWE